MCALNCDDPAGGDVNCDAGSPYCDAGAPNCDPCQVPTSFTPCPPGGDCNCRCDCGDFNSCCYQQPARAQLIRPAEHVPRPVGPMEKNTTYKLSYIPNGGDTRAKMVFPCVTLRTSAARPESCTVQKLSYMAPCGVSRVLPIRPTEHGLNFTGPLCSMTSQKHDFPPKSYSKRGIIHPTSGFAKVVEPLDRCTINKLSYMPVDICTNPPPKPIVRPNNIMRPTGTLESCTVQKLSYLPVSLPQKDPMPWADKTIRSPPPRYENLCTTYNLSYMQNKAGRTPIIHPVEGLQFFGTSPNDGNTVYKLSYMPVNECRVQPILPRPGLQMPTGPFEKCTVQKLSYQPTCCVERTQPIRPKVSLSTPAGPLQSMTTQKHDFVPKPMSRRALIRRAPLILRATAPLEACTVNKLSYMPVNVCQHPRPAAILPVPNYLRSLDPIDKCTTYKLSYMPNSVQPRQPMPWAGASSYVKPVAPIEKCTIQKLSYGPPGNFSRCGGCNNGAGDASAYPKAGIC